MKRDIENIKRVGVFVGQSAPDFSTPTLDDEQFKLSDLRGKVALIDFWATWCAPCVAELPTLKKAHQQFADKGLVIVSISIDKKAETARAFATERGMKWPQVWAKGEKKSELAKLYAVEGVPATFLVGPDGKVVAKDLRGRKLRQIEQQIGKLEPGKQ